MEANVGSADRNVRVIAGVLLLVLAVVFHGWWSLLGLVGLVLLFTAFTGFCLLYVPFRINTAEKPADQSKSSGTKGLAKKKKQK